MVRQRWARVLDPRVLIGVIAVIAVALLAVDWAGGEVEPAGDSTHERIDAFVRNEMDGSRIPGVAIAVVEADGSVYARGYGDDGRGHAITPETPFWIGSNTKSFTALAVMQLAEAGKVDLDAPVQRYLPQFQVADADASAQITVRHLLNQTSGFSRADGLTSVMAERNQSIEEAVTELRDVELNRPVGESFQYSNLNFVVLGLLVQTVSGEPWADYIQTHIFQPLGMMRSYTSLDAAKTNGLTETHRYVFGVPIEREPAYLSGLAPTGWLYSTAEDMTRYLTMYLRGGRAEGGQVLSEAGIAQMLAPATNRASVQLQSTTFEFQYGEGWFVGRFGAAEDARWHQGSLPEFTAWMVLLPETHQAVVVLINAGNQFELLGANEVMSRISTGIVNVLRGEEPPRGIGITRFFLIFDVVVAIVLVLQVWSLVRVARRRVAPHGMTWLPAVAPLVWEVGLSLYLLGFYPAMLGTDWAGVLRFIPDLSLVVLAVSLLWLTTGVIRTERLVYVLIAGRRTSPRHGGLRTKPHGYR